MDSAAAQRAVVEMLGGCTCHDAYTRRGRHQPEGCAVTWTEDVFEMLERLPVEQRMEAMGMVPYDEAFEHTDRPWRERRDGD